MSIMTIRNEGKRGCGFRKPGGTYLVTDGMSAACGRLPVPLDVCPCCGHGIKPARGWTWINPQKLFNVEPCAAAHCGSCPVSHPPEKAGLIWIGEKFYKTTTKFTEEAARMGVSRRLKAVPKGFKIGETWVFLAHRKAHPVFCECVKEGRADVNCETCKGNGRIMTPAIFHAFRPDRIEYILKGDETEEDIERMEKRGITPVRLIRDQVGGEGGAE